VYSPYDHQPFNPKKQIYMGRIELDSQPRNWIAKHQSFASKEWFESQVRFGIWLPDKKANSQFLIYAEALQGIKPLTILLKIQAFDSFVLVYHAHVLRKK
jgi:hypothetical protein